MVYSLLSFFFFSRLAMLFSLHSPGLFTRVCVLSTVTVLCIYIYIVTCTFVHTYIHTYILSQSAIIYVRMYAPRPDTVRVLAQQQKAAQSVYVYDHVHVPSVSLH
jgi:hypothetical protein